MADVVVEAAMLAGTSRGMRSVVFTNDTNGYMFGINGDSDLDYMKTTDGGLTWGAAVDVFTGTVEAYDVWYDQWTPGDMGSIIHIFFIEGGVNDNVQYERLDTRTDVQSGAVNIFDAATTVAGRGQFISGAKMRGGNLLCCFDIDAGAETGTYRSVDNGATWGSRTNVIEATLDQAQVFPANVADANDGWFLYHDASTHELTLKEHDDSANTNSESAALTLTENATDATGQYGFSGAIRFSDGHLIAAFCNEYDSAGLTGDLKVYDINGTGSLTVLTDIITNTDDFYYPSVFMDQRNDVIYCAYIGKSDGSETLGTTAAVYYATSKDRGASWTKDIAYSTSSTDYRQTWAPLSGSRFLVVWMDISALSLNTNYDNSKTFGPVRLNNYQFVSSPANSIMWVTEKIR